MFCIKWWQSGHSHPVKPLVFSWFTSTVVISGRKKTLVRYLSLTRPMALALSTNPREDEIQKIIK